MNDSNVGSTFTVEQLHFVCIVDLDEDGKRSLTNDIERALARMVEADQVRPGDIVLYRDSEGWWDQVVIDLACRFVEFRPLRARTQNDAIIAFLIKHEHIRKAS